MDTILAIVVSLALGFVLGAGAIALRIRTVARNRQVMMGAATGLARFLPDAAPQRTAQDRWMGRVRVRLGGVEYAMPVLSRADSRTWVAALDTKWGDLPTLLTGAADNVDESTRLLLAHTDRMLDSLLDYDRTGCLPPREDIDRFANDAEILHATAECWLAANPLAAALVEEMLTVSPTSGATAESPSSVPSTTAGTATTSSTA